MQVHIPEVLRAQLPAMVVEGLARLSPSEQLAWLEEYERRSKRVGLAYLFWLLIGSHYAYRGKWAMQLLFWCTAGGFFVWWLVDAFRIPGIVRDGNRDVALDVMRDVKALAA